MSQLNYLEKLLGGVDVEWLPLGNLAEIGTGKSNRQDETEDGEYPFYVRSKNILRSSTFQFDEKAIVVPGEGGIGDIFHFVEGKYALHQRAYRIKATSDFLDTKFLYHFMSSKFKQYILMKSVGATSISIRKPMLEGFQIPIPCPDNPEKSLAIQAEIVRILDTFTAMTAELTAELNMRKKQYNYYRDQLLSFEEGDVEWRALSEIAEYSKARISYTELDDSNYVGVESLLQNRAGKIDSTRTPDSGNLTQYNPDDILIGNIRPYLKKIWHADRVGGTNGDVLVVQTTDTAINPRYLYQVLADDKFFEYNMQHAKGAKMPRGNKPKIMEYLVPIPFASNREKSLSEQERIVTILDKFDTLTSSITEGLPREIDLRQKQYEYYRDLLLSFPKPHSDEAA
ncbi:restriction endonuclease subunit S [Vibrio cholerae]|uniref:restriction endonuclease subunit S n=1 Tax=Vibrio cholerae TaxID=666 RepID=UPI0011D9EF70|nr:restriction endonuclease subunit S [Vibrio cholerae]EGR0418291.1 restriction endonuclease subunit S [Vibrio cholerae]TXY95292.1 restriction endonuclease subunit S [Vibrio cholerae]GHZ29134.1 Type I restriction-modification system, specificity subunit S [Vibrio cholerae]